MKFMAALLFNACIKADTAACELIMQKIMHRV